MGIGIAGRARAVEGALDALLEHGDGDGVEAGDRRALTLVADADHDHRAGLADGTEGLPDVLVLDDADADDRRVKRDFPAQKINQKWYGDGTEIKTGQGKLYLASVLDMASRRVLGFALGEHHDAALTHGALAMAVAVRDGQVPGVIMHTDRGSEYTAGAFRAACQRLGACQSMGRPGSALDNAVIESWHSTLEFELRSVEQFATKAAARARVPAWIHEYNHIRRHSACQMMSPVDYERALAAGEAA